MCNSTNFETTEAIQLFFKMVQNKFLEGRPLLWNEFLKKNSNSLSVNHQKMSLLK